LAAEGGVEAAHRALVGVGAQDFFGEAAATRAEAGGGDQGLRIGQEVFDGVVAGGLLLRGPGARRGARGVCADLLASDIP
jgi:hypothetical protein